METYNQWKQRATEKSSSLGADETILRPDLTSSLQSLEGTRSSQRNFQNDQKSTSSAHTSTYAILDALFIYISQLRHLV